MFSLFYDISFFLPFFLLFLISFGGGGTCNLTGLELTEILLSHPPKYRIMPAYRLLDFMRFLRVLFEQLQMTKNCV